MRRRHALIVLPAMAGLPKGAVGQATAGGEALGGGRRTPNADRSVARPKRAIGTGESSLAIQTQTNFWGPGDRRVRPASTCTTGISLSASAASSLVVDLGAALRHQARCYP